ncbi:MAG: chorismate-binding protein [Candidatus Microthrix sp.]|nr:chorismate-binding protein [Candidatus Microthrix sp.]
MNSELTRERFGELAADFTVVPVWRQLLADLTTPVAAFARLCEGDEPGFLLESVELGGGWGRWSFVGRRPLARLSLAGGQVTVDARPGPLSDLLAELPPVGMLATIEAMGRILTAPSSESIGFPEGAEPPLHSGLVGYLGYDVVREVEHLPDTPLDDRGFPEAVQSVIGELAAYDHFSQRVTLIVNVVVPPDADEATLDDLFDNAVAALDTLTADGARPLDEPLVHPPRSDDPVPPVRASLDETAYCQAVEVAKEHILDGDIFQVVLSTRYEFDLDADPFDVYRVLRQINPSPYMFFVREPELVLVGCSPEPLVQLLGDRVISRPIAGTRFRGSTPEHDRKLAAELAEHPKERAEHLMLVDLARNDVGRVVQFGTCEVEELMTLEKFSHVMHLTSQVAGTLAEGKTPADVLAATLPAGTVSGAPKVRAMELIDELEPIKRGPYSGVVGYLDFSGNIDTAIAIRTMVIDRHPDQSIAPWRGAVQAGAGIVADSDPADEYLETRNKAKALLVAVPAAERMTAQRRT